MLFMRAGLQQEPQATDGSFDLAMRGQITMVSGCLYCQREMSSDNPEAPRLIYELQIMDFVPFSFGIKTWSDAMIEL